MLHKRITPSVVYHNVILHLKHLFSSFLPSWKIRSFISKNKIKKVYQLLWFSISSVSCSSDPSFSEVFAAVTFGRVMTSTLSTSLLKDGGILLMIRWSRNSWAPWNMRPPPTIRMELYILRLVSSDAVTKKTQQWDISTLPVVFHWVDIFDALKIPFLFLSLCWKFILYSTV